jgi:hypothetical protein
MSRFVNKRYVVFIQRGFVGSKVYSYREGTRDAVGVPWEKARIFNRLQDANNMAAHVGGKVVAVLVGCPA